MGNRNTKTNPMNNTNLFFRIFFQEYLYVNSNIFAIQHRSILDTISNNQRDREKEKKYDSFEKRLSIILVQHLATVAYMKEAC